MSKSAKLIIRLLGGKKINLSKVEGLDKSLVQGRHYYIKHWPFPSKTGAITLKKRVLHRDKKPTVELIMHEERHVQQYLERKTKFHWSYLLESIKNGYRDNRYERDARKYARKFRF